MSLHEEGELAVGASIGARAMKFELLADKPEAIDLVAHWYFEEWGRLNPDASVTSIARRLSQSMNRDKPPLLLLAVEDGAVLGAAELKVQEMAIYPDKEYWLGGVFVAPHYRGRGIGAQLVERIILLAGKFGIEELWLQTERLDGGLYSVHGWQPFESICYRGANVLVMRKRIDTQALHRKVADHSSIR